MGGCVPSGPEAFDTVCSCQRFMFRIPTLIVKLLNNVNMTEILTSKCPYGGSRVYGRVRGRIVD